MASGRRTALTVSLTPGDRQTLLGWRRSRTISARRARRARIILLLAEGMPIAQIARTVGMNRPHIYKWVRRFLTAGLAGLIDQPRHDSRRKQAPHDGDPSGSDAHAQ